jgi:hypothetical protein
MLNYLHVATGATKKERAGVIRKKMRRRQPPAAQRRRRPWRRGRLRTRWEEPRLHVVGDGSIVFAVEGQNEGWHNKWKCGNLHLAYC